MCHYTVPQLILFKKKAGEMGLWLKAQVALSEDLFGSQHPHVGSSLSMTPVPRGCDAPLIHESKVPTHITSKVSN